MGNLQHSIVFTVCMAEDKDEKNGVVTQSISQYYSSESHLLSSVNKKSMLAQKILLLSL